MKQLIIGIIGTLLSLSVYSQSSNYKAINLQNQLKESKADSNRVRIFLSLAEWYQNNSNNRSQAYIDTTLLYTKQAEALSRSLGFLPLLGEALLAKSRALVDTRARADTQIIEARIALTEALRIYSNTNDKLQRAEADYLFAHSYRSPDSSRLTYFQSALKIYKSLNSRSHEAKILSEIALTYRQQGRLSESIRTYLDALAIQESIQDKSIGITLYYLAVLNNSLGDYPKALEYAFELNRRSKKTKDSKELNASYQALANIYEKLGDFKAALQYSYLLLQVDIQRKSFQGIVITRLYISTNLLALNRNQQALNQAKAALKLAETDVPGFELTALLKVGDCYFALNNNKKAEEYYKKAEAKYLKEFETRKSEILTDLYQKLGVLYLKTNHLMKAAFYLNEAYTNEQYFKSPAIRRQTLLSIYQLDSLKGNPTSALIHYRQYTALNDSLVNEAKNKQIALLQIQFDTEKKVQDIKLLQQQNQLQNVSIDQARLVRNITLIGIAVLALLLWLSYNRYRIKKRSNQLLESKQIEINQKNESLSHLLDEKEWLLKEIHHRVKNNLQLIISLLQSQGRYLLDKAAISAIEQSEHRVRAMALIHQKLYRAENLSQIDMPAYIQEVAGQLSDSFDPQKRITIQYTIAPLELDVSQAIPLGLIINEAITNAFKYAFPGDRSGTIQLSMAKIDSEHYRLCINDNGVGLPRDFDLTRNKSMGANIMRRLSKQLGGAMEVQSHQGVEISIVFTLFHLQPSISYAA